MPAANTRRPVAKRLGLAAGAGLVLASVALIAAAPARRVAPTVSASQGRVLQLQLAEAPPPKLQPAVSNDTLDVRPAAVDAPISPELASVQTDATLRAMQAQETRQAEAFDAEQRRESARMDALMRQTYEAPDPLAEGRPADPAGDEDDTGV